MNDLSVLALGEQRLPNILVRPIEQWDPQSLAPTEDYDLFVGAVGYETRAIYIAKSLKARIKRFVAAPFPTDRTISFAKNLAYFASVGHIISGDAGYRSELTAMIHEVMDARRALEGSEASPLRVCVDISSMSRLRIAETMRSLYLDCNIPVDVDWLYAPAKFTRGLSERGPVQFNDAVAGFEGWGDPTLPLHAVVGIGLEGDLVLGVLDDLEPADTWFFEPTGFSLDYDRRVKAANRNVLASAPASQHFTYRVADPFTAFLKLSALVDELAEGGRVVLFPLGPKVFALMCFILGVGNGKDISVWRLSIDAGGSVVDRVQTGVILGLRGVASI